MTTPPRLFDRTIVERNRQRARHGGNPALFLQEDAAEELLEKLSLVNRSFTAPAIVTPWPEVWQKRFPDAQIVNDADVLQLEQSQHDLVIHSMGLHWANDAVGQLIQTRRALKPDGLFLAALFGGQTLSELRAILAEAEVAATGGLSPRVAPMAEIRDLGGLLQRAGFALPVADSQERMVSYRDAVHLMHDLRAMGEGNALTGRHKCFVSRNFFLDVAQRYADAFSDDSGRVTARFEMVFLTGWAPDASQPKPLRPGSANASLAEALGTSETPLRDRD